MMINDYIEEPDKIPTHHLGFMMMIMLIIKIWEEFCDGGTMCNVDTGGSPDNEANSPTLNLDDQLHHHHEDDHHHENDHHHHQNDGEDDQEDYHDDYDAVYMIWGQ